MKRFLLQIFLVSLICPVLTYGQVINVHDNLLRKGDKSILVVSHRADWRNAPENSLQAIQNCIDCLLYTSPSPRD